MTQTPGGGWRELGLVLLVAAALTVLLTYPLALQMGSAGRLDNADGQFSVWNVAWVARTLVVDPLHVYDANIFYPNRRTLAYSENNLGAGILAIPVYWATRNPFLAHNWVVLLSFILAATGMYYLVGGLAEDRRAAAVSAICYAFCPFVFGRLSHIQLLMTAGLPFAMLALHCVFDRPSAGRGAVLGLAMAAQAIACGYYGIFVVLMVGFGVVVLATTRRMWTDRGLWIALGAGALAGVVLVGPVFAPYVLLQRVSGFRRSLDQAVPWSADWRAYVASSARAHRWLLPYLGHWNEVLFPGCVASALGLVGLWNAGRSSRRDLAILYGGLTVLACWASFGPQAGLYTWLYHSVPVFSWLRAPARFGLIVVFGLSVLAGLGVAAWLSHQKRGTLAGVCVAALAAGELGVSLQFPNVKPAEPVYPLLATLPRGPVIEMPFFYPEVGLFRHAAYMLNSTAHWMPLVNGYSDYIPPDFMANVMTLAPFPSRDALKILEPNRVRYAVFHRNSYNRQNWNDVLGRLKEFEAYLRPLYVDDQVRLYEIIGFPP